MKKILFFVLLVLLLTGCAETIGKDNYFVVTKVEEANSNIYGYAVTMRTAYKKDWGYYKITELSTLDL